MEGLPITPWTVFLYALLTAVATGLGALPFLFTRGITPRHLGLANAAAAGLMVAASFGLIYEGVNYSLGRTLVGVGLGLLFILLALIFGIGGAIKISLWFLLLIVLAVVLGAIALRALARS